MNKLSKRVGPRIVDFALKNYKTSNTLFVLGSGASINEIMENKWEHINEHDSIGLNRWPVHDHVPTYHVFEMKMCLGYKAYNQRYLDLLKANAEAYSEIPVILKNTIPLQRKLSPDYLPAWLAGNLILSSDTAFSQLVSSDDRIKENKALLEYLLVNEYFDEGNIKVLYRKRGSISYLLHLGVVLGYDTIVLCGVDMVNSDYFFEDVLTTMIVKDDRFRDTNRI